MKKGVTLLFAFLILVSAGALAQTFSGNVDEGVSNYIQGFINKSGIESGEVKTINEIDQSNLPKDLEIKKIDSNNLGIYEVNYTKKDGVASKVFVVTYSTPKLKQQDSIKNIQSFVFGTSGVKNDSIYLDSATGVMSRKNIGYVMLRGGSLTGLSTSLEIYSGDGNLKIKVYKNGEDTGFENLVSSDDKKKIDYDLQSEDVVNYKAGDVISVYVLQEGDLNWGNVITTLEVTS